MLSFVTPTNTGNVGCGADTWATDGLKHPKIAAAKAARLVVSRGWAISNRKRLFTA